MPPIRLVLVDDHNLFREGMAAILSLATGITVVGEASNSHEAAEAAMSEQPDVILLDVEIPGDHVTTTIRRLRRVARSSRIIILTMHRDKALSEELQRVGASAYVTKSTPSRELVELIRQVHGAPKRPETPFETGNSRGIVSPREHEVLRLIAQARSNAEIATSLSISIGTVKRHTHSIYAKLSAVSRMDAVRRANLIGLLSGLPPLPQPRTQTPDELTKSTSVATISPLDCAGGL